MIELVGFSKSYKAKNAVSDFDMVCAENEITGLIGLNGAGKTTILKAVCARHFASSGNVFVDGVDCALEPERVRRTTGFVQEKADFPGDFKVSEFIRMRAEIFSASSDSVASVVRKCDLEEIWDERIKNLSKGQQERVNFAQALVNEPSVLVLDEPASGLDPSQIVRMRKLVKSLKGGRTILLSTHLMQEVDALCDKVYIISSGRRVEFGTPSEIVARTKSKNLEDAFFKLTSSN